MLLDVDFKTYGGVIEEILEIVKPLPDEITGKERDEIDEWRQMYVMSSHFAQWEIKTLKKFLERIKGQKERKEKIDHMNFSNL
jgi:hypothetical protein